MLSLVLSSYYSCSLLPSLHQQTSPKIVTFLLLITIPSSGPTFHLCHGTEASLAYHDFFIAASKDAPWFLCFSHSTAHFISECFLEYSPFLLTLGSSLYGVLKFLSQFSFLRACAVQQTEYNPPLLNICCNDIYLDHVL